MNILDYFPFESIREKQKDVIKQIEESIESGIKYIFLEAPTGFGKSPIAIALARYLGSSHICTSTKDLQNQYSNDFPFIKEVKGKQNFKCLIKYDDGIEESCEYGPCQKEDNFDCIYKTRLLDYVINSKGKTSEEVVIDKIQKLKYSRKLKGQLRFKNIDWEPCYYFDQKWIGNKSSHTIYNYKYFLSELYFSNNITKRELLVFDEVHNIESEISDFKSFTINGQLIAKLFPKLKIPNKKEEDIDTWINFCEDYRDHLFGFIDQCQTNIEKNDTIEPIMEKNLIDSINKEKNLSIILNEMKTNRRNWIVTNIEKSSQDDIKKLTLTPLDISKYFKEILDSSSYGLFMSATILNKQYLSKLSGLLEDKINFIRIKDSDFPKKNRPIHLMNVSWLNNKTMVSSLPTIAKTVDNIMSIHKYEKGIIHTTSYFQLNYIKNNLSVENRMRLLETHPLVDRIQILKRHVQTNKPSVLISPSLYQGLDLKDDLSRFQILIKVPYPDLGNKKIAAMKQKDMSWYLWNTVIRIVQAYGRSIRSNNDHATTYILDSNINYLLNIAKDMFPKWFVEAIVQNNTRDND